MSEPAKRSRIITLSILAVVGFTILEWRPWHSWLEDPAPMAAPVVANLPPEPQDLDASAPIRAQLSPVRYTTVTAELSARVKEIPVREGEGFKEGQRLVIFDCATQEAQLGKARAVYSIAERNFVTNKKLLELGSVGRIEFENSESEFQKAKAEVQELTAVVAKCVIRAPFQGRVVEQKVRPSQFVQSGQPVIDILDQSALELEFIAPSKWVTWLVPNYQFQVKVDETGKLYPAKITRVGAKIDSISQTVKIAAVVDGDFPDLAPGMSGTLELNPPKE